MIRSVVVVPFSCSSSIEPNPPILLNPRTRSSYCISSSSSPSSRSSSSSSSSIPKLEPFSRRSKLDRVLGHPPLIQKTESDLADYCSTLEGDPSYSCWRGYFELKELENTTPKEEVEKLIIQAGGVKSLISCLHGISANYQLKNELNKSTKSLKEDDKAVSKDFHIPDGLPKSAEELEEEEKSKMPDSAYTRMLRTKGTFPAWYSPAPDHETD